MSIKILVLSNMYPPHHLGGYEQSCRDVVERWRGRGHHVDVLTTDMRLEGVADPPQEHDHDVRRDLSFYWRDHEILRPSRGERVRIEQRNHRALRAALDRSQPHVVSVWHMGAMSMSLLTSIARRGIPMVFVVCDDWMVYGPEVDPWIKAFRSHPVLAKGAEAMLRIPTSIDLTGAPTAFCFISDFIAKRAARAGRWSIDRSVVVYNGIATEDFPIADPQPRPWRWRLLFAGRVEERKGVHVAVRALSALPSEARLDVDGPVSDAYRSRLTDLGSELGVGDRVSFARTPRSSLRDRYRAADVVVHPVVWDEPLGLVPVEAMASGTPVVATATGGAAEYLLDDRNALVVPPDDPGAIAEAVRRLAADESLRDRIIRNGRTTAQLLDVDRFAEDVEAWHLAAADHFRDGEPDRREPLAVSLSSL